MNQVISYANIENDNSDYSTLPAEVMNGRSGR